IDPFYLSWKSKQAGIDSRFIELAGQVNGQMPLFVVEKIQSALNDRCRPIRKSRIHVVGIAYKRDIDDVRESPALDIMHLLMSRGARVTYSDPFVPSLRMDGLRLTSLDLGSALADCDCAVIVTDHSAVDYRAVAEQAPLVVDTRNALKGIDRENVV